MEWIYKCICGFQDTLRLNRIGKISSRWCYHQRRVVIEWRILRDESSGFKAKHWYGNQEVH